MGGELKTNTTIIFSPSAVDKRCLKIAIEASISNENYVAVAIK